MAEEKYQLSLEGSEVDEALQMLVDRVPEGWAAGTANGAPVGSASQYYHNNAKYYAGISGQAVEDANAAAERAEAAVPAGTAGAVFFDRAQTLTTVQQEQARENINAADNDTAVQVVAQTFTPAQQEIARKNIAAGGTNPNLLDNPWFQINQRGITTQDAGSTTMYCLDRWRNSRSVVTANADGTITVNANTSGYGILQIIEKARLFVGSTYTLSVLLSDGTIYSGSFTYTTSAGYFNLGDGTVIKGYQSTSTPNVNIWVALTSAGVDITIRAVKLELGTVSTLANDVPPNYAEELAKCQHYLYAVSFPGDAFTGQICLALDTQTINWNLITPVPMVQNRIPSITASNSLNTNGVAISGLTSVNYPFGNNVKISGQASGLTGGQLYAITTDAEVKVLISTEP